MDNTKTKEKVARPEKILNMVQKELDLEDISIKNRTREMSQARFIYFKLARKYCRYASLSKIGKVVKRDHATVINGLKKFDAEAKYDPYMYDVYDNIAKHLDIYYVKPGREEYIDMTFDQVLDRVDKLENKINKFLEWKN
jgi:chromosomal replication initiation ATPase DnaA